jgi:hypothetical protein
LHGIAVGVIVGVAVSAGVTVGSMARVGVSVAGSAIGRVTPGAGEPGPARAVRVWAEKAWISAGLSVAAASPERLQLRSRTRIRMKTKNAECFIMGCLPWKLD